MNITFIGGGNMAQAIIGGLRKTNPTEFAPENLHVVEVNAEIRSKLEQNLDVRCFAQPRGAVREGDVVIFAVKPQQMREAATELREKGWARGLPPGPDNLVISIAAGVRLTDLARWLRHNRLIRAMPNTPALIGEGVTALYPMPMHVSEQDMRQAELVLGAVGKTVRVLDEAEGDRLMDAVTAVSGSGPAYVFLFIEAMEQAATELGLAPEVARKIVLQTFIGAGRLAAESPDPVSLLRERVTSKGGTTERALGSMAADRVKEAINRAIRAAYDRGRELGDEFGKAD
jgi:pyrroline-5-carboxylate reductase